VLFRLIIPRDTALVPALRLIAERVAQCAGYTSADAQRIASSVGRAVEIVLSRPGRGSSPTAGEGGPARRSSPMASEGGPAPAAKSASDDSLDIRFERDAGHLNIWLRYRADQRGRPVVDPALSSEALRQGMDSAEFGREGEAAFCRLRRALPHERVEHQCEMPPDAH